MASDDVIGTISRLWRYPVKSMQGTSAESLTITPTGVESDRDWGLFDTDDGRLLSGKRHSRLLEASACDDRIALPDGSVVPFDADDRDAALSAWLGRPVELRRSSAQTDGAEYEMTFDPPNDDADVFAIPTPPGRFVDLAPVHLVADDTLRACADARPDLDWDVRRFRPNVTVDGGTHNRFAEQAWLGRRLHLGEEVVLVARQPTVRCALPLRAQPATLDGASALARQPELFAALNDLNAEFPNHLGLYLDVAAPGTVHLGDTVRLGTPA